jgi:hypothetical protein
MRRIALLGSCVGLVLIVAPAFAGDARTTVGPDWATTGNSLTAGFLGTVNPFPLVVKTNNVERLRVTPAGNVGIGILAPADRLSVRTPTNSYGITHTDGTTTLGTWVGPGQSGLASGWLGTRTNAPLRLFANDSPAALSVYPSGEVGIGSYDQTGSKLGVRSASLGPIAWFENGGAGRAIMAVSNGGEAVRGETITGPAGVYGHSNPGYGLVGVGNGGIYAEGAPDFYAGVFVGDVRVFGDVVHVQDHPLDPANRTLSSAAVSANERLNVFSGNVVTGATGEATVQLPAYFSAANTDPRYQLTVVGRFAQAIVAREIEGNRFTIRTDRPNVKVSWQVTAVRSDASARAHPFRAEQDKPAGERGNQ